MDAAVEGEASWSPLDVVSRWGHDVRTLGFLKVGAMLRRRLVSSSVAIGRQPAQNFILDHLDRKLRSPSSRTKLCTFVPTALCPDYQNIPHLSSATNIIHPVNKLHRSTIFILDDLYSVDQLFTGLSQHGITCSKVSPGIIHPLDKLSATLLRDDITRIAMPSSLPHEHRRQPGTMARRSTSTALPRHHPTTSQQQARGFSERHIVLLSPRVPETAVPTWISARTATTASKNIPSSVARLRVGCLKKVCRILRSTTQARLDFE
jgi:hypothetical protein